MKQVKSIEIPEGYVFDKIEDGVVKLKKIGQVYPLSIGDVKNRDYYIGTSGSVLKHENDCSPNQLSTESRAKAFLALIQLVELCDAWNKVDVENGHVFNVNYFIIWRWGDEVETDRYGTDFNTLQFIREETRDKFLEQFRDLIEEAKELL